jgi:hypothetical protein
MYDCATVGASGIEAVIRFATPNGVAGPTLHIKSFHGGDRFELWAPGGKLIGDDQEFTLLGLINAAVHGESVL